MIANTRADHIRQILGKNGNGGNPDTKGQNPEQQGALVGAPDCRDLVHHRQQGVGIFGDIGDGKIMLHERHGQQDVTDGHRSQQSE